MSEQINQITTIEHLTKALENRMDHSFLEVMRAIEIPYDEFEKHFTWKEERYTRNSILKNDDYELLVICWERAQDSPIHDYDSKEAWIHIIRGELKEEKYKQNRKGKLERVSSVTLGLRDFSYMSGKIGLHRYINSYEGRSVSLQLYVPPLEKWNEYDPSIDKFKARTIGYDLPARLQNKILIEI